MVLRLATAADQLLKITPITKLHDDENLSVGFIYYSIVVFHNICVI